MNNEFLSQLDLLITNNVQIESILSKLLTEISFKNLELKQKLRLFSDILDYQKTNMDLLNKLYSKGGFLLEHEKELLDVYRKLDSKKQSAVLIKLKKLVEVKDV